MEFHDFDSILPEILTGLTFSSLEHAVMTALHSCAQHHSHYGKALFPSSFLALTFKIPQPSFILVVWVCDIEVLCVMKDFMVCYSLHINLLWVSVVISIYHKKVCLWWGLRDAPIYGYRYTYLGYSLVLCPFDWIILESSP